MYYGTDYYPEHWPQSRWREDASLMQKAGFNLVRLGEFAWSLLEPEEGIYDFTWLDHAIEILAEHNIQVILGTPTAAPPPWLTSRYPEVLMTDSQGRQSHPGGRRFTCPSSPTYRRLSRRIAQEMAAHYASSPSVIGWQIDNELSYGQPASCFCEQCQQAFQDWLRNRYNSLDSLNQSWGTVFWSQIYTQWNQIPTPLPSGADHNPGLVLDYSRFQSDAYINYMQEQLEIIRLECPEHFVTHNIAAPFLDTINNFALAKNLDFLSEDTYPGFWQIMGELAFGKGKTDILTPQEVSLIIAWSYDAIRGNKAGQPFWVMEQQSGPAGQSIFSPSPRPNQLRLWVYQAVAHGAKAITHFRWRTCTFGAEEYWHGILDHAGIPGRRYEEIAQTASEMHQMDEELFTAKTDSEIAIIFSYDSNWALKNQPCHPDLSYVRQHIDMYAPFYGANIPVDFVSPDSDFSKYKLILAPALHVVSEELAQKLSEYVKAGGTLIAGLRTGVKDKYNRVVPQPLPGLLRDVFGMEVIEYDPIYNQDQGIRFLDPSLGNEAPCKIWADILHPTTSQILAEYTQDFYAGKAAITLNEFGTGKAIYIGGWMDNQSLNTALLGLANRVSIQPVVQAPPGVEVCSRSNEAFTWWFFLNHTPAEKIVNLPASLTKNLPDQEKSVNLNKYGVKVIKTPK